MGFLAEKFMKVSKDFELQEYVPGSLYNKMGDSCIWFLDQRLISLVQFIRDDIGKPIYINNWQIGGVMNDCGFRLPDSRTGTALSQHKFGRAADLHIDGVNYDDLRKYIQEEWRKYKNAGLTTIEADTSTWLHVDIRHTGLDQLYIVPLN